MRNIIEILQSEVLHEVFVKEWVDELFKLFLPKISELCLVVDFNLVIFILEKPKKILTKGLENSLCS